jgi:hypothetical protein
MQEKEYFPRYKDLKVKWYPNSEDEEVDEVVA